MKYTSRFVRVFACVAVLAGALATVQAGVGKAVVRSIKGAAECSEAGGWKALKLGMELAPGTQVRTGNDATVDLYLDQNGPLVRLTENTVLKIEKLNFENTGVDTVIETTLDLKSGRIVGVVKKLSGTSKYEVKTPTGVAGIRGTNYVIAADGTVNVLEGQIVVVFVKSDGGLVTQVVNKNERFNPATQKVEPIPSDAIPELARLFPQAGPTQPVQIEAAPLTRLSPVNN
jgi:hypothetical protein